MDTERRTQILPELQTNCGNEGSAGRLFPDRDSWHPGQKTPDHMLDGRSRFKRMRNKMVHPGNTGGPGIGESWEERLNCQIKNIIRTS